LLLPSTQKAFNFTELLKSYLAGGTRLLTATGKPTEIATIEIYDKTHCLRFFIGITSVFSYLYSKKGKTLHLYSMCSGKKTLKHNMQTTLQLAYHGCKNLTHTRKTRQVKRTRMVVTVGFTIRTFLTFSDW